MPVANATIAIERPPAAVFACLATAERWLLWQPAVLSVSGVTDRPLRLGEQVTTEYNVAGRTGVITWTVTRCRPSRSWTVEGIIAGQANGGSVAYVLERQGRGTRLARSFTFDPFPPLTRLPDALALHRQVTLEAEDALAQLKRLLEDERVSW